MVLYPNHPDHSLATLASGTTRSFVLRVDLSVDMECDD